MKISRRWLSRLPQLSIGEALNRIVELKAKHPFMYFYERRISFKEFGDETAHWREAMWGHGFGETERAVIFAENMPEWCMAFCAITSAGGIAVPVDANLKGRHLSNLIRQSQAGFVFTSLEKLPHLLELLPDLDEVNHIVVMDGDGNGDPRVHGCDEFLLRTEERELPDVSPDSLCTMLFTAGTTGDPKVVPLTHANILSGVAITTKLAAVQTTDCCLNPLPLFHVFPLVSGFVAPLCCGFSISLTSKLDRGDLNDAIRNHPATILICVPAFYQAMASRMRRKMDAIGGMKGRLMKRLASFNRVRGSAFSLKRLKALLAKSALGPWGRLRLCISGGAPLNRDVVRTFNVLGLPIMEGYGLTETCGGVILNTRRYHRVGSVGFPPNYMVEVRIGNPNDAGVGEILLRGSAVMEGYVGCPRGESFTEDDFFRTGDLGCFDKDGYLFVTGRQKDLIIPASGKNIYPEELEEHYRQSKLIKDVSVFGLPKGEGRGEVIHATIIPTEQLIAHGEEVAYEWLAVELEKFSMEMPSHKRVRSFNIWRGDFPRTSTDKVKKYEIREQVLTHAGPGGAEPVVTVADELLMTHTEAHYLCGLLHSIAPHKVPLFPNTGLTADLGFDSLRMAELVSRLEKKYNCTFHAEQLAMVSTVKDVILLLEHVLYRVEGEVWKGQHEFR